MSLLLYRPDCFKECNCVFTSQFSYLCLNFHRTSVNVRGKTYAKCANVKICIKIAMGKGNICFPIGPDSKQPRSVLILYDFVFYL